MSSTDTAEITTAEELDALPIHTEIRQNNGTEWKKFWGSGFETGYWAFRCLGGHNHDSKESSEWLAQYGPFALVHDPADEDLDD